MDLLQNLNEKQRQVVTTTEGPVLVLAGAGSGKTRSVIYRAAYLISVKQINPGNILVVTFTNKAARELQIRLEQTLGINSRNLWIGTFHAVCARILRREQEFLPFNDRFSIYDDNDQKAVMKKIYKQLNVDRNKFNLNTVRNLISRQKNSLIKPEQFFEFQEMNFYTEQVEKIYREYQKFLIRNNALDFDDLLLYTAYLLEDNKKIREKYSRQFQYVMIDEYQDTNYAQFKLVNLIAAAHQNLCVVGDDDQAIYSWRGADIRNILNFEEDYSKVVIIKLERNYRSPQIILKLANSLINKNQERHPKELWTELETDHIPLLMSLENQDEEATVIADRIIDLKKRNVSARDIVILYRTNAQSRVFEKIFTRKGLRYQIVGGVNFYQRKEIKDILAYLRILINPEDSESLLRIINFPARGIGEKTVSRLLRKAADAGKSLVSFLVDGDYNSDSAGLSEKAESFARLLRSWLKFKNRLNLVDLVKKMITDLELKDLYENNPDPQENARWDNISEFISATKEFIEAHQEITGSEPGLEEFLQNISLQTDLDNLDDTDEAVKLMTMHNAKGLEFDYVHIVGLEDGLLPHIRS
ncbi:MAG: UvrD-helicase domain-containing protein, partial [Candidatus Cloacimonetes bacterium]|nr:UvrD-helicase domain-containing protein [Candidatus Cloacimonadota bacterium]